MHKAVAPKCGNGPCKDEGRKPTSTHLVNPIAATSQQPSCHLRCTYFQPSVFLPNPVVRNTHSQQCTTTLSTCFKVSAPLLAVCISALPLAVLVCCPTYDWLAAGLSVLLVTGVLKWKDCLNYPPAWDTLFWFAVLVGMSGQLHTAHP